MKQIQGDQPRLLLLDSCDRLPSVERACRQAPPVQKPGRRRTETYLRRNRLFCRSEGVPAPSSAAFLDCFYFIREGLYHLVRDRLVGHVVSLLSMVSSCRYSGAVVRVTCRAMGNSHPMPGYPSHICVTPNC